MHYTLILKFDVFDCAIIFNFIFLIMLLIQFNVLYFDINLMFLIVLLFFILLKYICYIIEPKCSFNFLIVKYL